MVLEDLKGFLGKNAITYLLQKIKSMKLELQGQIEKKSDFSGNYEDLKDKPTIPILLPNPKALIFTGNVTETYDGSSAVTIEIPTPGDLEAATQNQLGGIKAVTKTELDTVPVKIGMDDILYVPTYPTVYMTQMDKEKLDGFRQASDYALKSDLTAVYKYKGTLEDDSLLPSTPEVGDTYNLVSSILYGNGANVAWNGEEWDNLGAVIDLSPYLQKTEIEEIGNVEIDTIWNTVFGS